MQKKTKLDFTHFGKLKEITIVSQYTDIKEIKLEGFNFQKMYEEYMDRNNYKYDKNLETLASLCSSLFSLLA